MRPQAQESAGQRRKIESDDKNLDGVACRGEDNDDNEDDCDHVNDDEQDGNPCSDSVDNKNSGVGLHATVKNPMNAPEKEEATKRDVARAPPGTYIPPGGNRSVAMAFLTGIINELPSHLDLPLHVQKHPCDFKFPEKVSPILLFVLVVACKIALSERLSLQSRPFHSSSVYCSLNTFGPAIAAVASGTTTTAKKIDAAHAHDDLYRSLWR